MSKINVDHKEREIFISTNGIISPWKYTKNGQEIALTNGEAVRLLQKECYDSIKNQDLVRIIDVHKDMCFMMQRSEQWFRIYPNHSSFKKQLQSAEDAMNSLTEDL